MPEDRAEFNLNPAGHFFSRQGPARESRRHSGAPCSPSEAAVSALAGRLGASRRFYFPGSAYTSISSWALIALWLLPWVQERT